MTGTRRFSRRAMVSAAIGGATITAFEGQSRLRAQERPAFSYPMALPGRPYGDGFFMRHGFTVENTWYLPGFWHAGEDWYLIDGDAAGANVHAIADGEVVYSGGNYPGLVVIMRHAADLFSMYGHLDFGATVAVGDEIGQGDPIGTVLSRGDAIPNHLHFEVRTFLQTSVVNGDAPLYGFGCGPDCPPGPGYWPIDAPELPAEIGWLNPTHAIANRSSARDGNQFVVVPSEPPARDTAVWSAPADLRGSEQIGDITLDGGAQYRLLTVDAGADAPDATSAEAYRLWYEVALPDGGSGWVQGLIADSSDTGSDGRPSAVRFNLLPGNLAPA